MLLSTCRVKPSRTPGNTHAAEDRCSRVSPNISASITARGGRGTLDLSMAGSLRRLVNVDLALTYGEMERDGTIARTQLCYCACWS